MMNDSRNPKTIHDPIGQTIPPFTAEDITIVDAQLRYLDQVDDARWLAKEINHCDFVIAQASAYKRKLFQDKEQSHDRRIYLQNRKNEIIAAMELARVKRAAEAEERRKTRAREERESRGEVVHVRQTRLDARTKELLEKHNLDPELLKALGIVK